MSIPVRIQLVIANAAASRAHLTSKTTNMGGRILLRLLDCSAEIRETSATR
jgi:hypothetical protein